MATVNPFRKYWQRVEENFERPSRYTGWYEMPFSRFREKVLKADDSFARDVVESIYSGKVWLLRGAFDREFMAELRQKTVAYMRSMPPSFHKMLEGSPDFHRIIDLEAGKKYSFHGCKHSAYFYRWNDDPLSIWGPITERWRVFKLVMGLKADQYEDFTPKDGVVDRIQVVRYPPAIGFLEPHADPYLHQRLFFSVYMSKRGKDYQGGGFYLVDEEDKAVEFEDHIDVGDVCVGYATVYHGVAPCDRQVTPDWEKDDGRWFLSLYSNASDEVAGRHTGHPVKVNIPGVLP